MLDIDCMLKTYLYIPDHLDAQIRQVARVEKKSKAAVMRQALEVGLDRMQKPTFGGAEVLLQLAEIAKKYRVQGPFPFGVGGGV